ncbi:MAG: hydantoinase B/oxoprolinase family protein, partial [Prochlorotrichaceae cyanobacterium]
MGGTSTDVAHFAGEYERLWETEIAGVRMRVPSLAIHTVAAGGGSILQFDGQRFQVGPASAGANPGPACYRRGGPLTVTDANLLLGRLQADYFPAVFGPAGNLPLDPAIVRQRFEELIALNPDVPGGQSSVETIAEGFLTIAVENMANAIQKISLQRGYDLEHYTLCCFGGAGGQVACRLAERLGMGRILLHPYAGVLSAYGMGLAEQRLLRGLTIEEPLTIAALDNLPQAYGRLWSEMSTTVDPANRRAELEELEAKIQRKIDLKYEGTDTSLSFEFSTNLEALQQEFDQQHQQRYGFLQPEKALQIASISLEYIEPITLPAEPQQQSVGEAAPIAWVKLYSNGHWHPTPLYDRRTLAPQQTLTGPALIREGTGTIVLEPGWQASFGHLTDPETSDPKRSANLILERIPSPPPLGRGLGGGSDLVDNSQPTSNSSPEENRTLLTPPLGRGLGGGSDLAGNSQPTSNSSPEENRTLLTPPLGRGLGGGSDLAGNSQPTSNSSPEENQTVLTPPLGRGGSDLVDNSQPSSNSSQEENPSAPDPVRLEVFKNRYQFIAEQMGIVLQNTAASVNIKERLDFSCAIFDQQGDLVANAPHIPVHLGSMSESVKALVNHPGGSLQPGQVYLSNNPYNGGTHLPDVTVITPMFDGQGQTVLFYLASRGHQADLGGITPGSMPPHSKTIAEEGILFDNQLLVNGGQFQDGAMRAHLRESPYPARNPDQNLADFKAQIAANARGIQALTQMVEEYGITVVQAYMKHVQNNAEQAVREAIGSLQSGQFTTVMDNGIQIAVKITVDAQEKTATIDFTGTSPQGNHNFNTPTAVVQAVVLYVFRTLVQDSIPLNAGCLKPLQLIIPPGCLLNPQYPAAVVAGNVETSQTIADTLYGAIGCLAASQGTMNNLTFGDGQYQYYETICGGSGAGKYLGTTQGFAGTDAVQTHMTNSRITDPEILESRFPVSLDRFAIRQHSGGRGQFCGGNGVIRQLQFHHPLTVSILSNRRRVAPFGLAGGEAGQRGENLVIRANGDRLILDSCAQVDLQPGDRLVISTPGGGGYGEDLQA